MPMTHRDNPRPGEYGPRSAEALPWMPEDASLVARAMAPGYPGAGEDDAYLEDACRVLAALAAVGRLVPPGAEPEEHWVVFCGGPDPVEARRGEAPTAHARPSEYVVCALPENHPNYYEFTLRVVRRAPGQWAVCRFSRCLGADGLWDFEPSDRSDEWKATHRFDLSTALRLAQEAAPTITVNGWTVQEALAEVDEPRG